jgi:hypothetical protein
MQGCGKIARKGNWPELRAFFWAQDAVVLFVCSTLSKSAALPAVVLLPLVDVMLFPELLTAPRHLAMAHSTHSTVDVAQVDKSGGEGDEKKEKNEEYNKVYKV